MDDDLAFEGSEFVPDASVSEPSRILGNLIVPVRHEPANSGPVRVVICPGKGGEDHRYSLLPADIDQCLDLGNLPC